MKFEFLFKYFPREKFLKPPHIGISFSDSNIKAISFDKTLKEPSLKSIVVPIKKGAIVAGSIMDINEITKKLSLIKESLDSSFVFFTIPDELAYVFSASVLVANGGDMTESVAFIMEENVPLSLDDIVFDFVPTGVIQADSKYNVSVVVAASPKKEMEKFIEAFYKSGFEPVGCIHESQAIANALVSNKTSGTLSIVHARGNRVGIYLVKNNLVHFSTLRSILDEDYKKQFLDEYEKFLEYCSRYDTSEKQPVKSIFVCGEFEYAKKIVEAIIDSTNLVHTKDVKLSNVWTNIFEIDKHLPSIPYEESLNLAGPIGATLADII
ncbi:MAG: pilus assembly protein PilM [Patescibacteria group bacterium]